MISHWIASSIKPSCPNSVEAPIAAGDTVGKMHIMLMGEEIGTVELVATQDFSTFLVP